MKLVGFTRGEVLASGFVIQPKVHKFCNLKLTWKGGDPKSSIVTYLTQVDLKGIPSSIINLVSGLLVREFH